MKMSLILAKMLLRFFRVVVPLRDGVSSVPCSSTVPRVETDMDDDRRECLPNDGNECFFSLRGDVWGDDATEEDGGGVIFPLPLTPGEEGRGTSAGVGSGSAIASGFTSAGSSVTGVASTAAAEVASSAATPLVAGTSSAAGSGAGVCVDGSSTVPFVVEAFSIRGTGVCVDGCIALGSTVVEASATFVSRAFSACPFSFETSTGVWVDGSTAVSG